MKKRMLLALALVLCAAVLAGCQSNEPQRFPQASLNPNPQATQNLNLGIPGRPAEDDPIDFDDGSYDPMAEEEPDEYTDFNDGSLSLEATAAPTVRSEYAGATPVVIDPIDKPTPTPVPPLTFTYQAYDATRLRLKFEGPAGWAVDESATDTFVLRNPDPSMDYAADVVLRAANSGQMSKSDMTKEVKGILDTLKGQGFKSFSPSNTAERPMMGHDGVYANYKATLEDGTKIAGRVHVTCIDKTLYTLQVSYPQAYTETYIDGVYDKVRHSMEIVK